jgi:diguanylate cyclase (GGDEF)-like protein
VKETGSWLGEIWDRRKNGEIFPKWLSISSVTNSEGEVTHYIGVFSDITAKKQTEDSLYYMTHFDSLTGLANRRFLHDRLEDALKQAQLAGKRVAVLWIDLDSFKIINDNLGHKLGDALLKEVAERLKKCVSDIDTVARMGGDEYSVVLPDVERTDQAAGVAQEILDSLRHAFYLESHEVYVSASIGIALYPYDSTKADELLLNAGSAMSRAKQVGRNTIQFSSPEINQRTTQRLQLHTRLRHALEGEGLQLYYQPQIDLRSKHLVGVEALLRWIDPEMGSIAPNHFIPIAEETGLIQDIGEFVLRSACRQCWAWKEQGLPPIRIAVNISAQQLKRRELTDQVAAILEGAALPATRLEFELTESMLVEDLEETIRKLERLKTMGITLAIDDFGTGYSSLSYLKRLPIDRLKIDKSFILGVPEDQSDVEISAAVIAMGQSLRLEVLAEGVETDQQIEFLKERECFLFQGYYCSPPVPPDQLVELIHSGHCVVGAEAG